MADIVEGNNPLQTEPEFLGEEQTRPVNLSVMQQLSSRKPEEGQVIHGTRKGPGRPRKITTPSEPQTDKEKESELRKAESKRKIRKAKTDEYTARIMEEANEQIMSLLIGQGVPVQFIYQDGQAPVAVVNSKYTEFGNRIAIKPMQARAVAGFLAQMETSDQGAKVANAVAGGGLGMAFSGVAAGVAVFTYVRSLVALQKQVAPLLAQAQAYKAAKETEKAAQAQQGTGVM